MSGEAVGGLAFFVAGAPQPEGSPRAFLRKDGRAAVVSGVRSGGRGGHGQTLGAWRQRVATEAQRASDGTLMPGPVTVSLQFLMPKPKSAPRRDHYPAKRPDIDKLARACLDALTGIAFADDSQVCSLFVTKVYAPAGTQPGVAVAARMLDGDDDAARYTGEG